jgi:hypothetical protein
VTQVFEKIGAGEGNRTLVISLEGCCSTIELHPHRSTGSGDRRGHGSTDFHTSICSPELDPSSLLVGEVGLEPTKP